MKFPAEIRKYMKWKLIIKVWFDSPSMKCTVTYGLSSIDLPRHLDEVWGRLRWITDIDWSERRYKIIEKEVNDMLRDYYLNYNCSGNLIWQDGIMAEQFNFPEIEIPLTNTYTVQNGQVHITTGATPTYVWPMLHSGPMDYVDRHVPHIEYLSDEEYQEKREKWELESWALYCVLN